MKTITDTLQISRSNQYARGIEKRKRYKPTLVKRIVSVHKIFSQTSASIHIKQI